MSSRKIFKSAVNELASFIPSTQKDDQELSLEAKAISDRPLVFMVKKLSREDKYNLRGLAETESREVNGETQEVLTNMGSVSRYIWEHCVVEVKNVLTQEGEFDSVKGRDKDALFDTQGMDTEIMEAIGFAQKISTFTEEEAKK